jgi:hypothetical protein
LNDCLDAQGHGYRPTFRENGGKDRETVFLSEVYDLVAEARGLPLRAYRPQQAKPVAPTLQSIKAELRTLREEAHPGRVKGYPYVRSGGNEIRLIGSEGGFYEYWGSWDGTLKELKDGAVRCRDRGGDTVSVGGRWLCCDCIDGDYEPCDGTDWGVSLSVDEILAIGKKAEPPTYQKVRDLDGTSGVVYEVRVNQEYVDNFKRLADVKRAYPNAVKRGDD